MDDGSKVNVHKRQGIQHQHIYVMEITINRHQNKCELHTYNLKYKYNLNCIKRSPLGQRKRIF